MPLNIGMVIALQSEAVCLGGRQHWRSTGGPPVKRRYLPERTVLVMARSGMGVENAAFAARHMIARGAGALVSIGVSAGTGPGEKPGDLVVADRVFLIGNGAVSGAWQADGAIAGYACRTLSAAGLPVRCGILATAAHPVVSSEAKSNFFKRFDALALDMESAAVAATAMEAGIPFFILRAVSDPVMQPVPPQLFACLDACGRLRFPAFCREAFSRPALVPELASLAVGFRKACRSLKAGWSVLEKSRLPGMLLKGSGPLP